MQKCSVSTIKHQPKVHGFQPPYDTLQYVAVVGYFIFILHFCVYGAPMLEHSVGKICFIILVYLAIGMALSFYVISALLPAHDKALDEVLSSDAYFYPPVGKVLCSECNSHVASTKTKHCNRCHKCVCGFDHHCKWLNTCIGERNYRTFAFFLTFTTILLAVQLGLSLFLMIESMANHHKFKLRVRRVFGHSSSSPAVAFFQAVFTVIEVIALIPLVHLLCLHIYFWARGISTYEWIIENREVHHQQKVERMQLGMEPGTPQCHDLAVWNFQRKIMKKTESKSKYADADAADSSPHGSPDIQQPGDFQHSVPTASLEEVDETREEDVEQDERQCRYSPTANV